MEQLSVEKKLQLINQVRARYDRDQNDLWDREQILYGKTSAGVDAQDRQEPSAFGLRLAAALLAFLLVLFMDQNGKTLFGVSSEAVFDSIARDSLLDAKESLSQGTLSYEEEKE